MSFDVKKHVIKVQGNKEYLPVAWRLVWFREEHPDWRILTTPIELNLEAGYAIYQATIQDNTGNIIGMGTKSETRKGFSDFIEKAETGAVGRALAVCGYGTQFEPELDEGERLADSPQVQGIELCSTDGCTNPAHAKSVEHFGVLLCVDCGKKRKNGKREPEQKPKGNGKPAADPVMAKLCILCNEYWQDDEPAMRQWFGAEYGVEHRTELTRAQKIDAITKIGALLEADKQGTL